MTIARRLALALIFVSAMIGVFSRLWTSVFNPSIETAVNRRRPVDIGRLPIAPGDRIGPFGFEGFEQLGAPMLRLTASRCEGAIFMAPSFITRGLAEKLIAQRFPADQWWSLYVHHRQTYEALSPFRVYLRAVAARVTTAFTLSPLDVSETLYFHFHAPVGCVLERADAVVASDAVLALARQTLRSTPR